MSTEFAEFRINCYTESEVECCQEASYYIYKVVSLFKIPNDEFLVQGSNGASYTIKKVRGRYRCSCEGFYWRKRCSHIDDVMSGTVKRMISIKDAVDRGYNL